MISQTENSQIILCLQLIEQKLGWGSSVDWATQDFERLSEKIALQTGVMLSISTLKRIWGKVKYDSAPTHSTLNALASFLGHENWHVFKQKSMGSPAVENTTGEPPSVLIPAVESVEVEEAKLETTEVENHIHSPGVSKSSGRLSRKLWWTLLGSLVILISAFIFFSYYSRKPDKPSRDFEFSSRPITRSIPNSVVFTYDASGSLTDSVYIQQSWDVTRRVAVDKNGKSHTSVYYEPGFFQAKLVAGNRVVKEHPLLVPTDGWLGLISTPEVPVYLSPSEFIEKDMLNLATTTIEKHKINMEPSAPLIKYFNVGNFEAVPLRDFSFTTKIKQQYKNGAAACQFSWIVLMTDGMPVAVQLSQKGCVSELNMMDGKEMVSGKTHDLSAFGVDFSEWVQIDCKTNDKNIDYFIDGKLAYSSVLPSGNMNIVGLVFGFRGTGAVKAVKLYKSNVLAFEAF